MGGWTTPPPETWCRDPWEPSDSTPQTCSSQSQFHICSASLPLPLASSTSLQLPTQAWVSTGSHRPTQAPPRGGRETGCPSFWQALAPDPFLSPAPVQLEGSHASDAQLAPGKVSCLWSRSCEEGEVEEGGRPRPLGDQGGSQAALRDTPAMGMDCSDSPALSQAFLG